ncbi:uncharacterized protein LOC133202967 [Saccostrea echinata]|uniref:uncharacterized protein LOC133202967 n=1 Tax=Saccostrea echinata TaxID=191078 RepID=UPI002A802A6E|nr:uncharacterized protein LOC133202967 [Saccostrea echinata]
MNKIGIFLLAISVFDLMIFGKAVYSHYKTDKAAVDTIQKIQKEYWSWRMENEPEYGTYIGLYANNDRVYSYDISMFEVRKNKTQGFLNRLNAISSNISSSERINYLILKDTFETYINGSQWAWYGALNPMNFLEGVQLYTSAVKASSNSRGDFENYIARLNAIPHQIDEIEETFREAIRLNRTYHNVSVAGVPAMIDKFLVEPIQSSFYSPFNNSLTNAASIPENEKTGIRERGLQAVNRTIEAYRKIKEFIINEYMPNTRSHYGVNSLQGGSDYYRACLTWHLSFNMTPEEVHKVGEQEVERIHGEMKKTMQKLGHTGTVKDFFNSLVNDSRFYSNNSETILAEYNDIVFNRINPKLPEFFKNIPDVPLEIRKMTYDGPGGGYSSATEEYPGVFSINLFRPLENPFFDFMALSLHEASPGHHLQHSYALKANLPDYRRHTPLSFYDVPVWFPWYSAYSEGWALYSEYLGVEMGLYKDDYELMGRYSAEILRACRLVVDTGLHYYNWDKQKAIDYMLNYTAYSYEATEIEVNRYITWPGQACAYKIGEIKIKDLRKKAETELGTKFDLRDFHSIILNNGAVPMSVLEMIVEEWIEEVKATPLSSGASNVNNKHVAQLCVILVFLRFYL